MVVELVHLQQALVHHVTHLSKGAVALFPKGQDLAKELTEAAKCWKIKALALPSLTDPKARILRVEMAERLSDAQNDRD